MWVRSEYAGELAVLSAWLCALLPWGISYASNGDARLFRIHFIYLFLQFIPGIEIAQYNPLVLLHQAPGFPDNTDVALGYQIWIVGAAVFSLALVLSIAYYVYEEDLEERLPVDPVRLMGVLLIASAVPFTATVYLLTTGFAGVTVPVGILFMYVLGGLLLTVERT
ncbi:MAG: hypothetical protein ACI8UR_000775 [Natronomonas sp.]|jgi:uncharacterized protein (TIGR04206 family)|uniref:DUF7549 family protein n=1 Tax=Natronomonas sp. TaxID=2184060 RepID=UPI003989D0C5